MGSHGPAVPPPARLGLWRLARSARRLAWPVVPMSPAPSPQPCAVSSGPAHQNRDAGAFAAVHQGCALFAKAFTSKGWAGATPQQPLQRGAVVCFDEHTGIETPGISSNTPSSAHTWKCTCPFRLEPNRWMKATAPMCSAALSTGAAPGQLTGRLCAMARRKMRRTMLSTAPSRCMKQSRRFGTDSTHWRTGSRGKTWSVRCAAAKPPATRVDPQSEKRQGWREKTSAVELDARWGRKLRVKSPSSPYSTCASSSLFCSELPGLGADALTLKCLRCMTSRRGNDRKYRRVGANCFGATPPSWPGGMTGTF